MVKEETRQDAEQKMESQAGQLEIIYYTDPLCCWSWAMEPQLRKLGFEFAGEIAWRYCMGGLLPAWQNYNDEVNSVTRPIQMGPVWMHAQQVSGMPMNSMIWMHDPPASSYPSCIATKCAAIQSNKLGERYLRLTREALMLEGKNIAKEDVLIQIARQLHNDASYTLDMEKFMADFKNDNGLEAFRNDLQEINYRQVRRFPTIIMRSPWHQGVIITGYRPYAELLAAVKIVAPQLEKKVPEISENDYRNFWGAITKREAEEINIAIADSAVQV